MEKNSPKPVEDADRELVTKARQGDVESFGKLVNRYKQKAYFVALGYVRNHEDALDLSQDSFVKAFKSLRRFDTRYDFYPWLYRIVKNSCLNHLRRQRVENQVSLESLRESGHDVASAESGPAEVASRRELSRRLMEAIETLKPDHREIIMLRHFHQMSYAEIAQALGCPQGTVMSRLHAARRVLKNKIAPHV